MSKVIQVFKIAPLSIACQYDGSIESGNEIIELTKASCTPAKWLNKNSLVNDNDWGVNKTVNGNDWTVVKGNPEKDNDKFLVLQNDNYNETIHPHDWVVDNVDYSFVVVTESDLKQNYQKL